MNVGQQVWVYDTNSRGRGPSEGAVTKVGRKLVTVRDGRYGEATYRIDTGRRNDSYGHQWIRTASQRAEHERTKELLGELRSFNLEVRLGYALPLDALEAVVAALKNSLQTDQNSAPGTTTLHVAESG